MMRRLAYWVPAICIAAMISGFSTDAFSSDHTSRILIPLLHWLFPFARQHTLELLHTAIRKSAHLTEFGIFSGAVFFGVRAGRQGWRLQWALVSLLIAVSYAGLDEWHQSFVPTREARVGDVVIDSTGALLAQALVWSYAKLRRKPAQSPG